MSTVSQDLVPLSKIVRASIIDTYGDYGAKFELHTHWAARVFKEMLQQYKALHTKLAGRKILLKVNRNTFTATLPCDCENVLFVGGICDGKKIPLKRDNKLINQQIIEVEEEKKCDKCGQDTSICNDLQVTETLNTITINDEDYTETIVKKLYPNGDYYLETTTPHLNLSLIHTDETRATAGLTVDVIGEEGDTVEVFVIDPNEGLISLGSYTQTEEDTDVDILAASIAAALQENDYGYEVAVSTGNDILIVAPAGLGDDINDSDDERLSVSIENDTMQITVEQFTGGVAAADEPANTIEYDTTKKFIANLDLLECGCLAQTEENLSTLRTYCPDTYYCNYAPCYCACDTNYGGYNIFENAGGIGFIQLDLNYPSDQLYIEYNSFLKKINGQYYVPAVAFEALVEGTKFLAIDGKPNVANSEKVWRFERLKAKKTDMKRVLYRFDLSTIQKAAMSIPSLEINYDWYSCYRRNCTLAATATETAIDGTCGTTVAEATPSSSTVIYINREIVFGKIQFTVGEEGSPMIAGMDTYILKEPDNPTANVKNVKEDSVNVVVDGVPLSEDVTDQVSYEVTYTAGATTVHFLNVPAGLWDTAKVKITYAKSV